MAKTKNYPLTSLRHLRDRMAQAETAVIAFTTEYRDERFFVAVCALDEKERHNPRLKYALMRLRLIRVEDIFSTFDFYANQMRLFTMVENLKDYLGVCTSLSDREWIEGFLKWFGGVFPLTVPKETPETRRAVLHTICAHEGFNPSRIYPIGVKRNPVVNGVQYYRSEYNAQLAQQRIPELYKFFKEDKVYSFVFSSDPSREKSAEQILERYIKIGRADKGASRLLV